MESGGGGFFPFGGGDPEELLGALREFAEKQAESVQDAQRDGQSPTERLNEPAMFVRFPQRTQVRHLPALAARPFERRAHLQWNGCRHWQLV